MRLEQSHSKYKQSLEKNLNNHLQFQSSRNSIQNSKRKKAHDLHFQKTKANLQKQKNALTNIKTHTLLNELENLQGDDLNTISKKYCGRIKRNNIKHQGHLVEKTQAIYQLKNKITNIPDKQRSLTFFGVQTSQKFINKFMTNQKKFRYFMQRQKNKSAKKFQKSFLRSASLSVKKNQSLQIQQKVFEGTIIRNIPKSLPFNEQVSFFNSIESKCLDFKLLEVIKDAQLNPLSKRPIIFSISSIPVIPEPPVYNCSLESLMESILKVIPLGQIQLSRDQFAGCSLKKYRNCIVFGLPNNDRLKLVWHFTGKLYIGEWNKQTNQKVGFGIQIIPNKEYYKGQFSSGKKYGKGIYIRSDSTIYQGEFINGLKHGKGKYFNSKEGSYYQGEWNNDKMFGFGFLQIGDNIYEGMFKSDIKQVFGTELFENGDKYIGQYSNDKFHGQGKYIWSKGSYYLGHFKQGNREGFGKWISEQQQSEVYVGFYTNDKKQGTGKYIWKNGCIYQGNFQIDKKEGMGSLQYPDGRLVQGIWKDNQLAKVISKNNDAHMNRPLQSKHFSREKKIKRIVDPNLI